MSELPDDNVIYRMIATAATKAGVNFDEMLVQIIPRDSLEQAMARLRDDDNAVAAARDMLRAGSDSSKLQIPDDATVIRDADGVWVAAWIKVAEGGKKEEDHGS